MAKKPLESTKVVNNNIIKAQTLKPKKAGNQNSNFSKLFKKHQTTFVSFALVLVLLVGGSLAYFKINNDLNDNDKASASNTDLSLYVSTTGDDNNPGTINQPFKTIYKARDYIRANKTTTASGNVTVNLRGGEYFLPDTFKLEAQDSATDGHTIIYQSYAGENATLSGGRKLTDWTLHDSTKNIYKSFVGTNGVKDNLSVYPRQMFVNGERAMRARSEENPLWLSYNFTKDSNQIITDYDLVVNGVDVNNWQNKEDVETVSYWNWRTDRCLVNSISNNIITEDTNCKRYKIDEYNGKVVDKPQRIENAYELLDSQNEWYYNKTDGYFYYKPATGFNFNTANIVTPQTEYLLNIQGDPQNKAHDIRFQNLNFQYGAWSDVNRGNIRDNGRNYIVIQAGISQSNKVQPSQITSRHTKNITFNNVQIKNMGSGGIELGDGAENNRILNSVVEDISGNGVTMGSLVRFQSVNLQSVGNVVYNNLISKIGKEYEDGIGVFHIYANKSIIKHNEVNDTPYSGMSICLGWTAVTQTDCHENTIEANKIYNTMHTVGDGGGIYLNGGSPNTIVKNNYLYDSPNHYGGLYPDDGSTFNSLIGNVVKSSQLANSTDTQPWLFMWNPSINWNKVQNNYYKSTKVRNYTVNADFGNCRADLAPSICAASQCSTPSTGTSIVDAGQCYGSNLQFTNDTDYPEINQIISRAGLCAVKNENYSECDLVPPCTNGAINPGTCDNFSPEGGVDKIENGKIYAWAKDGSSTTKVQIYYGNYVEGVIDKGLFDCNKLRTDVNTGFGCEVDLLSVLGTAKSQYTAYIFAKDTTSNFTKYLGSLGFYKGVLGEVDTVTCTPNPAISGSKVNCTANLVGSIDNTYAIPPEGLYLGIRSTRGVGGSYSGNSDNSDNESKLPCTINLNILTCNNVPVPSVAAGKYQIVGHIPNVRWVIPNNDTGIDISPYIVNDSSVGSATCTPNTINKSPTDTAYTNCTFPLTGSPNGVYALPAINTANGNTISLAAGILNINGDANTSFLGNSDPCTISGQTLVCNNVRIPSYTNLGNREIIIHQPNINYFYGKGFLTVDPPLVVSDVNVGTATCTQNTINKSDTDTSYTNCTFPLTGSPNGVYALPAINTANGNTISLAAGILNINGDANTSFLGNSDPCTISGQTLVCNNVRIPSYTNLGNREIIIHQPNINYFYGKGFLSAQVSPITDPIFLPSTTLTESPNPQTDGLKIFGGSDYSLTIKDTRLVENNKNSVCYFKIKEVTSSDNDTTRGYEKLTSTVLSSNNTNSPLPAYDTTTKSYKITYDPTNGVNIKLAKDKQSYTDYNLQIRCTRSDNQLFGRDQKINFLFGAYSVVDISGVGV